MIVSIVDSRCYVYRELGDPVFRPNRSRSSWSPPGWCAAESRLLHNVQKILDRRGYDLIKKRMWRDGHMFGSEHSQYLRSRNLKAAPSLYVHHADYALEVAAENYNVHRGFTDLASAMASVENAPGDACRLIDQRSGESALTQ